MHNRSLRRVASYIDAWIEIRSSAVDPFLNVVASYIDAWIEILAFTDDESLKFAQNLPKADILVSHDSPKFIHTAEYAHSGLEGITEYLKLNEIPLNIHGHHHVNTVNIMGNGTQTICVYRCAIVDNKGNVEAIF